MKKENLFDAIQNIDDMYVVEAASLDLRPRRRKSKKLWLKVASIAACFMAVVLSTSMLLKNNNVYEDPVKDNPISTVHAGENVGYDDNQLDDTIDLVFNNAQYLGVEENWLNLSDLKNLPATISPDMIGEYLGDGTTWEGNKVPVYAYTASKGGYYKIINLNGQYMFIVFCCFVNDNILTPRILADMVSVNDSSEITKITIEKTSVDMKKSSVTGNICRDITDESLIDEFWNAFLIAESIRWEEYIEYHKSCDCYNGIHENTTYDDIANFYDITIFFQNGIEYSMSIDICEGVYYLSLGLDYVPMYNEVQHLINQF